MVEEKMNPFIRLKNEAKEKIDQFLKDTGEARSPLLRDAAFVKHEDGSTFLFEWATAIEFPTEEDSPDLVIVPTEHHGTHGFSKGDLSFYKNMENAVKTFKEVKEDWKRERGIFEKSNEKELGRIYPFEDDEFES